MNKRHFGKTLRNLRRAQGLTQGELAKQLGLGSHAHVSNLEQGRKAPSLMLVRRIAQFFQVPLDRLLLHQATDTEQSQAAQQSWPRYLREGPAPYMAASRSDTGKPTGLGLRLRALRRRAGLTQIQLARRLGLASHSYLSHLERGRKKPSAELLAQIAAFFGVPIANLVDDKEEDGETGAHA